MRKMKKAAALFMAAAMAASLSACGGGSSTGTTTAPTQAPAAEGSEAEGGEMCIRDSSQAAGIVEMQPPGCLRVFFFYMAAEVVNLVWNGHTGGVRQGDFSDSHLEVGLNDGVYVFLCDTAFPWGGKRH